VLFNSLEFLGFFAVVTSLFFALPQRARWFLLLAASCWFYMAFVPVYIVILAGTIVVDYGAGLLIERTSGTRRRAALLASLIANVGVLVVFKYWNFFSDNVNALSGALHLPITTHHLGMILPIGLSFHTFQAMSYTIEVYRGNQKAERHFGIYALYVMFYPQLVAGPIERPQNLLHQFRTRHPFAYQRVTDGLKLMMLGFFKKIVVADRIAVVVDSVYSSPRSHGGIELIIATVFFAFQIYADFSGYSDIAIGCARVMGFDLMTNFRRPYLARSVGEFWQRWHISLSTWFRDYVYIPLGGSRAGPSKWRRNILITFVISGLWHGANWTYLVWGALNGCYIVLAPSIARIWPGSVAADRSLARRVFDAVVVFVLIDITWVFFRANTVGDATYVLTHLLAGPRPASFGDLAQRIGVPTQSILMGVAAIAALLAIDVFSEARDFFAWLNGRPALVRWGIYYAAAFATVFLGYYGGQQFIYFQF
jgi:alginate O-acetyltransferase complex protein AlgI